MIEGPEEWAVFTDPEVFGEVVTYTPQSQAPRPLTAIFTAAQAVVSSGTGGGVSSFEPVLTLGLSGLEFTPSVDDLITLSCAHPGFAAGTTLRVAQTQPDGTGAIRLILERT